MTEIYVFDDSSQCQGSFSVESEEDLGQAFAEFCVINQVHEFDYLESEGKIWTVIIGANGFFLESGRIKPKEQIAGEKSVEISTKPPIGSVYNILGLLFMILGCITGIFFLFIFDTTAGRSVHNIGLLNDRLVGFMGGLGVAGIGSIFLVGGAVIDAMGRVASK